MSGFEWNDFTIPLFIYLALAFIVSFLVWMIALLQLCCIRSEFKDAKWYGESKMWLTRLMLSFACGIFSQTLADQYVTCSATTCTWVSTVLATLVTMFVLALLWVTLDVLLPLAALIGVVWVVKSIYPTEITWANDLLFLLGLLMIVVMAVVFCWLAPSITSTILEWMIAGIASVIMVYFADYAAGAARNVFIGLALDLFGGEEYANQRMWHAIVATLLFASNRAFALAADCAKKCHANDPADCCYRCRNGCCFCCCETDPIPERQKTKKKKKKTSPIKATVKQKRTERKEEEVVLGEIQIEGEPPATTTTSDDPDDSWSADPLITTMTTIDDDDDYALAASSSIV